MPNPLVQVYNALKSGWSRLNDVLMAGAPRRPVPKFGSPEQVAAYLMSHVKYTGDQWGGAGDNYVNPERFQYSMETGDWSRIQTDCDDYATWAYVALKQIPGVTPRIFTLVDAGVKFSHVICVYSEKNQYGTQYGAIDTNGHRPLINIEPSTLCKVWNGIYGSQGANYISATETTYPF